MMKYIIFLLTNLIFIIPSWIAAQNYAEMMQRQKEILSAHSMLKITVEQKTFEDEIFSELQSFTSEIYSNGRKVFWSSPEMKMIQDENAYLLVQESQEVIFYSPFNTPLDVEASIASGMDKWQKSLNKYIENAISIKREDHEGQLIFTIITSNPKAKKAKVVFDKSSDLMVGMKIYQQLNENIETRLEYKISYEFGSNMAGLFNIDRFIETSKNPKGIGKYADYQIVYNPIE